MFMEERETVEKVKSNNEQPEGAKLPRTPQKKAEFGYRGLSLQDLSPFSPLLRTIKKPWETQHYHCDLAMIETPIASKSMLNLIDEVDQQQILSISKLLVWEEDQSISQPESSSMISEEKAEPPQPNQNNPNINNIPILSATEANRNNKKVQQTVIKLKKMQKSRRMPIEADSMAKKIICNCKKTQCLKLYCDCFRENRVCGKQCNCVDCHNVEVNLEQRNNAMLTLMERNPDAFKPKLQAEQHAKGCNCRKSGCQKKYCQCYQAGLACGEYCKCQQCKNVKDYQPQQKINDSVKPSKVGQIV